ncbi:MAG TPA: hypothetical protein VMG58_17820, partial [Candidatus Sulfotelmatobacter sp.]|nr:hypothetical protein [Candidatus Sulfotelmatobacter sp.]
CILAVGCAERMPPTPPSGDVIKRETFEIVARDNRCTPEVLAADRGGRSVLITLQVTSVGKGHWFLIPDGDVRRWVPAGMQLTIPFVVEASVVVKYACASSRWITPFTHTGKLAVR